MKAAFHLFASMLAFFALLAATPATGLAADDNCPSEENLLKFAETESPPATPLLPASVTIAAGFQPGSGTPAGQARGIQGTVLVIHKGGTEAYALQSGSPIFAGDTLITEKNSRVTMEMRDKSAVTLTAYSKLVIDRSLYNPDTGSRDTKLQLLLGRLRTVVSKMTGDSSYEVRTPTAVAGARGTDFALAVGPAPHKPSVLMTVLVTGGGSSTVELSGAGGSSSLVGPESVTGAVADCVVCPATPIGPKAKNTLSRIAPEMDNFAAVSGAAASSWGKEFLEEEKQFGLYLAVENALDKGIAPAEILAFIAQNREKLTHPSMKALYCSGVDRELVQEAAEQLGISKFESGRAFTESLAECGSKIALKDRDNVEPPSVAEKPDPADLREKRDLPPVEPPQPAEPPKEDNANKKDGQDSIPLVVLPPLVDPGQLIDYPDDSSGPVVSPSKPDHHYYD